MADGALYPWHQQAWGHFSQLVCSDRWPSGLLLTGMVGLGLDRMAQNMSQLGLCREPHQAPVQACGQCRGCRQWLAGAHPDGFVVVPEDGKQLIGVDQIRALAASLALTRSGERRIAVVRPADAMTLAAANSLLKTLEEPPLGTTLILVSHHPAKLPATIRSRCQSITVSVPPWDDALAWMAAQDGREIPSRVRSLLLELGGGAPLRALEFARDLTPDGLETLVKEALALAAHQLEPVRLAERWLEFPSETVQAVLWMVVRGIMRSRLAVPPSGWLGERSNQQQALTAQADLGRLHRFVTDLLALRRMGESGLQWRLALERLLVLFSASFNEAAIRG